MSLPTLNRFDHGDQPAPLKNLRATPRLPAAACPHGRSRERCIRDFSASEWAIFAELGVEADQKDRIRLFHERGAA